MRAQQKMNKCIILHLTLESNPVHTNENRVFSELFHVESYELCNAITI